MVIERNILAAVREAERFFPVITINGPRQSGKTTFSRMAFPAKPYVSLEDPDTRLRAEEDPRAFLGQLSEGGILDEVQRVPSLFSYLQGIVDTRKTSGMFILTGSDQFGLMEGVTQSLAGRTALFKLLPFSFDESASFFKGENPDSRMLRGSYPRPLVEGIDPVLFYQNYSETYVERDVRRLVNIKDSSQFRKFLILCAGRVGSILDLTALANDTGISVKTVGEWLGILEASFILFRLQPWHENRGKRLVKKPKLYFVDVGLAAYLAGIRTENQMSRDPLRGHLFENLVIVEEMKRAYNSGRTPALSFYRDSNGVEVDLLVEEGRQIRPIEIKSSATFHSDFTKGILSFAKIHGDRVLDPAVVYAGTEAFEFKGVKVRNYGA